MPTPGAVNIQERSALRTSNVVHCAMYAARSSGLTAVPVIHGMAAVLTMATRLRMPSQVDGDALGTNRMRKTACEEPLGAK